MLVFLLHTDNSILISPDDSEIDRAIKELSEHFNINDQGQIDDYLGIKVERRADGSTKLFQPHLINLTLNVLKFRDKVKTKEMPAPLTVILNKDKDREDFNESFHYRGIIGKLIFLKKSMHPDIACAVHQATCFVAELKASHVSQYIISVATSQNPKIRVLSSSLTSPRASKYGLTPTSVVFGIRRRL
jgi:hypothetical protein